mmetsp:Transcript_8364/g.15134  ORF Transcript_8364/g.15134 Transcript_8364/m.15134 type:complete len:335 (-) Transcript_8364:1133-2137(-)
MHSRNGTIDRTSCLNYTEGFVINGGLENHLFSNDTSLNLVKHCGFLGKLGRTTRFLLLVICLILFLISISILDQYKSQSGTFSRFIFESKSFNAFTQSLEFQSLQQKIQNSSNNIDQLVSQIELEQDINDIVQQFETNSNQIHQNPTFNHTEPLEFDREQQLTQDQDDEEEEVEEVEGESDEGNNWELELESVASKSDGAPESLEEYFNRYLNAFRNAWNSRKQLRKSKRAQNVYRRLTAMKLQALFGDCDHRISQSLFQTENQIGEEEPKEGTELYRQWCDFKAVPIPDAMRMFINELNKLNQDSKRSRKQPEHSPVGTTQDSLGDNQTTSTR